MASAQDATVRVCVRDEQGAPVAGARVAAAATAADGCVDVAGGGQTSVDVVKDGFARQAVRLGGGSAAGGSTVDVVLRVAGLSQTVQVTAARVPLALDASASSVRTMTGEQLKEAPGFSLDDSLRQVAGFQLFRRTSSWVANPTTVGTSMRGLGSTAVSRTLVLSDQQPLNDAYGGWIHWDEIPSLAMREVELMRGGASDLYGSSAIGGVIDVVPVVPEKFGYALNLAGATKDTSNVEGMATAAKDGWSGLGAVSLFRTGGYILTAPQFRGPVDTASNVHSQSGRLELRRAVGSEGDVFVRGNLLNEARSNGTVLQNNGVRIWRYTAGGDWNDAAAGRFLVRFYGTNQKYRQSFTSVNATRTSEKLTGFHVDPAQQVGGAVQWGKSYKVWTLVAGADVLDTRGTDADQLGATSLSARQRGEGVYGEALWQPKSWSIAFSSRFDHFSSFDAKQVGGTPQPLPGIDEKVFDPRLGVVKKFKWVSLTGSAFRAFRGPSQNELYRQSQVGQQVTLANSQLRAERATGFEFGGLVNARRFGSVRGSYFWTQVNRPVAAVTISTTATSQLLQRQNLGQLESRGLTAEWEVRPWRFVSVTGGYQFAVSTVTKYQADATLVGKWTPQVPRNSATLQARFEKAKWGVLSFDLRGNGHQFDDQANQYRLAGYGQLDLYAEHTFWRGWKIYSSAQNVTNTTIQAGKTPLLTLGTPRIVMAGIRIH